MSEEALQPKTLRAYQNAMMAFYKWAVAHDIVIDHPDQLDDFYLEFKNDLAWAKIHGPVTKSKYETLLAATQKLFPETKVSMFGSREVLKSWKVVVLPRHTSPMSSCWAHHLSLKGMAKKIGGRKAGVLPLQYHFCLRPTEALKLCGRDLLAEHETTRPGTVAVLLGTRKRIKAGRQHVARSKNPTAVALVNYYKKTTKPDEYIAGDFSLAADNKVIRDAMQVLKLAPGKWSGHSARSGRASDLFLGGTDFVTIRETGRWSCDSSLRVYLDVATVLCANINQELEAAPADAERSESDFLELFPWW